MHLSMCVEVLAVIHAIAEGGVLAEAAAHVLSSVMLASDLKSHPQLLQTPDLHSAKHSAANGHLCSSGAPEAQPPTPIAK